MIRPTKSLSERKVGVISTEMRLMVGVALATGYLTSEENRHSEYLQLNELAINTKI